MRRTRFSYALIGVLSTYLFSLRAVGKRRPDRVVDSDNHSHLWSCVALNNIHQVLVAGLFSLGLLVLDNAANRLVWLG
jgi:hypothetical protein